MRKLTKTLMCAFVGMGIGYFLAQNNESMRMAMMIGMAGFPAGWRAVSKWGFIPLNIVGFTLHVIVSMIVGWIILPVEIISGILELKRERV